MKNSSLITSRSSLSLKAPAKINWFLKVLGLRDDGFHEIQSLIQKITLYDILTIKPCRDLILTTNSPIPAKQNLVYKTALLLKETHNVKKGAHIHLEKHIPMAAGLGGGSSDAASALTGLNKLWALNLSTTELLELAQQLGSDVPVFLNGPLAFVEGRGEKITTLKTTRQFDLLLVKPDTGISTAWAYNELSVMSNASRDKEDKGMTQNFKLNSSLYPRLTKKAKKMDNIKFFNLSEKVKLSTLKNKDILYPGANSFSNDFETVIMKKFPALSDIKKSLLEEGAMFSMMTGSGSAIFGVFGSKREAAKAANAFKHYWTAVVKTVNSD
ncbi:MAG: 4-(cytidine 5'-diphospho)-2-C-methyl-D-erythritol kinase [Nitrospirae bacterium]|nr:4-(cytidine 5'-diphospho)-2-C-methyl-D-erythritol kinase [Nitrospirota bacterium]